MAGSHDASARPRVLVLGGGFAGVGAAMKLKKADADVVLVDRHDYHTFQPLLYQLATGLLETDRGRTLAPRPRPRSGQRHDPQGDGDGDRPRRARGAVRRSWRRSRTTTSSSRSARRSTSSAPRARPSTPSRCTRCPTRSGSRITCSSAGRRPTGIRASSTDGALNVVVVGGGPTGVETAGALAELYRGDFAKDYPSVAAGEGARRRSSRPGRSSSRCSSRTSATTRRRRSQKRTRRGHDRRGRRVGLADAGHAEVGRRCSPRTRSSGAPGLQGNELVQSLGLELRARQPDRRRPGPRRSPDHPEVFVVGDIAAITDAKTEQVLPQLGSVALQSGEHAGETIARARRGQGDEAVQVPATRARWRRSAAAPRSCRCSAAGR